MSTPLCVLSDIKTYLAIKDTNSDPVLSSLIPQASAFIESYCNRIFGSASYNEVRNGNNASDMVLRALPIVSVASLTIDTLSIPAAADAVSYGFVFDDQRIYIRPGRGLVATPPAQNVIGGYPQTFRRGIQNVVIAYTGGYLIALTAANEPQTIPAGTPYTISVANAASFIADLGVVKTSNSSAMTAVVGVPAQGQYSVNPATGVYTFNASDTGTAVLISYTYRQAGSGKNLPTDLTQACVELIASKFAKRSRIDKKSEVLAQQTVSFDLSSMPDSVKAAINPYVIPMVPR